MCPCDFRAVFGLPGSGRSEVSADLCAVAIIEYRFGADESPLSLASGVSLVAALIRDFARPHGLQRDLVTVRDLDGVGQVCLRIGSWHIDQQAGSCKRSTNKAQVSFSVHANLSRKWSVQQLWLLPVLPAGGLTGCT
ncbi:hypothetical protein D3C87_1357260 [compost metagenome]